MPLNGGPLRWRLTDDATPQLSEEFDELLRTARLADIPPSRLLMCHYPAGQCFGKQSRRLGLEPGETENLSAGDRRPDALDCVVHENGTGKSAEFDSDEATRTPGALVPAAVDAPQDSSTSENWWMDSDPSLGRPRKYLQYQP